MQKSGIVISRRRVVTAALLAVPLAGLGRLVLNEDVQAADVAVTIMNFSFQPTPLTIPAGTTVVWTNRDAAPHTATSDTAGIFDTGTLQTGQSGRVTFNTAGTITYHCNIHPFMHGTVIVTAAGAPAPAPAPAPTAPAPTRAPAPTVAPPAPPRTGGGGEAFYIRRLGDG